MNLTTNASRLRQLTLQILNEQRPAWPLRDEVLWLTDMLQDCASFQMDPDEDIATGEIRTSHGLAVSPTQAAMCAQDFCRTTVFLRGLHAAIQNVLNCISYRPVHVLYAGCGPYALLAVPLMTVFSSQQAQFTLLELNPQSLESAKSVVYQLGLEEAIRDYVLGDACEYEIPHGEKPDIMLSETMNTCLEKEPQVSIALNILRQTPHAALVPYSIRVKAVLIDPYKEFQLAEPGEERLPEPERVRVHLGTVFELNAHTVQSWLQNHFKILPGYRIQIPNPREMHLCPMLFTEIEVYDKHCLHGYNSGLTIPRPLPIDGNLNGGELLEFYYRLGDIPVLECRQVEMT